MPRGGRRRGAGAPHYNLNALRTGMHSVLLRAWVRSMLDVPFFRTIVIRLCVQRLSAYQAGTGRSPSHRAHSQKSIKRSSPRRASSGAK